MLLCVDEFCFVCFYTTSSSYLMIVLVYFITESHVKLSKPLHQNLLRRKRKMQTVLFAWIQVKMKMTNHLVNLGKQRMGKIIFTGTKGVKQYVSSSVHMALVYGIGCICFSPLRRSIYADCFQIL